MAVQLSRRRFTFDEYYRMAKIGILGEDDRFDLIDGEIIDLSPVGSRHAAAVDLGTILLARTFGDVAQVRVQNPLRLDRYSEPEPDLLLLRPRDDFYAARHPVPTDVLLLIEVADTSLAYERRVKLPLYAQHQIPEVSIEDLRPGVLGVYREPGPGCY